MYIKTEKIFFSCPKFRFVIIKKEKALNMWKYIVVLIVIIVQFEGLQSCSGISYFVKSKPLWLLQWYGRDIVM